MQAISKSNDKVKEINLLAKSQTWTSSNSVIVLEFSIFNLKSEKHSIVFQKNVLKIVLFTKDLGSKYN